MTWDQEAEARRILADATCSRPDLLWACQWFAGAMEHWKRQAERDYPAATWHRSEGG